MLPLLNVITVYQLDVLNDDSKEEKIIFKISSLLNR